MAISAQQPLQVIGDLMGLGRVPEESESTMHAGREFVVRGGVMRQAELVSAAQSQTREAFGFKWQKRDTFESDASLQVAQEWVEHRYGGRPAEMKWLAADYGERPIVLDAGCGAGMAAEALFGPVLPKVCYVGVDISEAVDVAAARFKQRGWPGSFMQADLTQLPFREGSVDVINSEGVLHHTDSTERALKSLVPFLKRGGRFLFYVYRKKGPIREFTDDYVRDKLQRMTPEEGWAAMMALTKLGRALGELNIEVDLSEAVDLLEIPAGKIDVQRLFYWHVLKCFYRPEFDLGEMNHINFDWFAPANSHRQTLDEVRRWCSEAGLTIDYEHVEEAGITMITRRTA